MATKKKKAAKKAEPKANPLTVVSGLCKVLSLKVPEGNWRVELGAYDDNDCEFKPDMARVEAPCGDSVLVSREELKSLVSAISANL